MCSTFSDRQLHEVHPEAQQHAQGIKTQTITPPFLPEKSDT
jgi:hypothetical protein